jgi:hypothetical protein
VHIYYAQTGDLRTVDHVVVDWHGNGNITDKKPQAFMNPAAFLRSAGDDSSSQPRPFQWFSQSQDTHSRLVARSSVGETATPRNRGLVGDLRAIHCNWRGEGGALSRFFQDDPQRNRSPERDAATAPQHAQAWKSSANRCFE